MRNGSKNREAVQHHSPGSRSAPRERAARHIACFGLKSELNLFIPSYVIRSQETQTQEKLVRRVDPSLTVLRDVGKTIFYHLSQSLATSVKEINVIQAFPTDRKSMPVKHFL